MSEQKTAVVTGVSGQDGAYLSALLLSKGYRVVGTHRPGAGVDHFWRLDRLHVRSDLTLVELDLLDRAAVLQFIKQFRPAEIYNLASFSSVVLSFDDPLGAAQANIIGLLNILDALRVLDPQTRVFQSSSSEMFGRDRGVVDESSTFNPQSPYAIAKASAHAFTRFYRDYYNVHTNLGILFNHDSPLRDPAYVSMKVATGLAAIRESGEDALVLGNIEPVRDWGFAGDYVQGMWACNQLDSGDVFVFSTGHCYSVRELVESVGRHLDFELEWHGSGLQTRGIDRKTGRCLVRVSEKLYRRYDGGRTIGDSAKANQLLGWTPRTSFDDLTRMLVDEALARLPLSNRRDQRQRIEIPGEGRGR